VGATSAGGKGTSWAVARSLLEVADPHFTPRLLNGFGSGEAVVDAVRDPDGDGDGRPHDTRLLLQEPEFARMLRVAGRDNSILSQIIRAAWDGQPLQVRSRTRTSVSTDHHIGVVAHVTYEELRARLSDTETYGGFSNRFLFALVRRQRLLPEGGNVPQDLITRCGREIGEAIRKARGAGCLTRTDDATQLWADLYYKLAEDTPGGLLGAVIGRAAPQCLRLSLLYALLDRAPAIDTPHVEAAAVLWAYSRQSSEIIFGGLIGDDRAEQLLEAITASECRGLDGTQQAAVFGRHVPARELARLRRLLEQAGKIKTFTDTTTGGRPRLVSHAVAHLVDDPS
jgi:hypothetical protein